MQSAGSGSSGVGGCDVEAALRELKSMQQQLDDANQKIALLKSGRGNEVGISSAGGSDRASAASMPSGPVRVKNSSERSSGSVSEKNVPNSLGFYGGFIEQSSDVNDKRIEQLSKEKRELIARGLEDTKEKMEMSQKLLQSENENASLKAKITKITLEKERIERKLMKSNNGSNINNIENVVNGTSSV